mgnify:CR=1 FL=1
MERFIFSHCGNWAVGTMMLEVTVDDRGRILIPKEVRDKVGLQAGRKARLEVEGHNIIVMPPVSPEEFIAEMEGCIRKGAPTIRPSDLKRMWEPRVSQERSR